MPSTQVDEPLESLWAIALLVGFAITVGRLLQDTLHWPAPVASLAPFAVALVAMYGAARAPLMSFARWCVLVSAYILAMWGAVWGLPAVLEPHLGGPLSFALPLFFLIAGAYWARPLIASRRKGTSLGFFLLAAAFSSIMAYIFLAYAQSSL
jgi:hypothetical protein